VCAPLVKHRAAAIAATQATMPKIVASAAMPVHLEKHVVAEIANKSVSRRCVVVPASIRTMVPAIVVNAAMPVHPVKHVVVEPA
jgi:hypothetical protein